jgi:hypothetical protein
MRTFPSSRSVRRAEHAGTVVLADQEEQQPARSSGRPQAAAVASCLAQTFPAGTVRFAVLGGTAVPEEHAAVLGRTAVPGEHAAVLGRTAVPGEHAAVLGRTAVPGEHAAVLGCTVVLGHAAADPLAFLAPSGMHKWAARRLEVSWDALELELQTA